MTIASEISKLISNLAAAYTSARGKGAVLPADQNFDNLADCIETIDTGTPVLEPLTVNPSTAQQTFTPTGDGFSEVTALAVTAAIDPDIVAGNIKTGVNILGVVGNYEGEPPVLETKTVYLDTTASDTTTVTAGTGYEGLDTVTVDISDITEALHEVNSGVTVL